MASSKNAADVVFGDAKTMIEAGMAIGAVDIFKAEDIERLAPGTSPFAVVPDGARVESLERMMPRPARRSSNATLGTSDAFADYVARYATPDTVIFYAATDPTVFRFGFKAIFNYGEASKIEKPADDGAAVTITPGLAGWGDNTAVFVPTLAPEFKAWRETNKVVMSQTDFARFLEDRIADIVEPDGAALFELITEFEAKADVAVNATTRLTSGSFQVVWSEEVSGKHRTGAMEFPSKITLRIPVIRGELPRAFNVRLRFRVASQKLTFWFEIVDLERVIEFEAVAMARRIGYKIESEVGAKIPMMEAGQ
jgi:uncharacterized protein YfdQ (DUF2303 family)